MAVVTFPFNGRNTNGETRTLDCDGEFSGHYSYYTVTLSLARSIGANLSKNLENARRSNNTYKSARLTWSPKMNDNYIHVVFAFKTARKMI